MLPKGWRARVKIRGGLCMNLDDALIGSKVSFCEAVVIPREPRVLSFRPLSVNAYLAMIMRQV